MAIFIPLEKLIRIHNESQRQGRITDGIASKSVLTSSTITPVSKRSVGSMAVWLGGGEVHFLPCQLALGTKSNYSPVSNLALSPNSPVPNL